MKKRLLAALIFAAFGAYGCGVIEVREPDVLTFNERMRLGSIYESKGEYDLALREYSGAQAIDTKEPRVYFALGNVRLMMKDFAGAEKEYLKSIELGPSADFYNNLAWARLGQGRTEDARGAVLEAVKTGEAKRAHIYLDTLGVVQMRAGEHEAAEESFKKAAEQVPGNMRREAFTKIYGHLAELYRKQGRAEEASIVEEKLELYKTSTGEAAGPGI